MLPVPDPTVMDPRLRTVVIGLVDEPGHAALERAAKADALWLRSATSDEVAAVTRTSQLPVGATAGDLGLLEELVAAGAVAVECAAEGAVELAASRGLMLWCDPGQVDQAVAAGVPAARLVVEARNGATVAGEGPAAWGAVVRAVQGGATAVRTTDVRSVRRVVAVTDRLRAARTTAGAGGRR